ncbi:MAG TPA: acyl-CoA dehydrogenase family protein [Gemmatimonadaceae bacterium]|nr:acyl-CoA dehydrogenase family protein [Gemmatimonadaceae bacterium]
MDFSWSTEQLELRDATLAFAKSSLSDDLIARDRDGQFSREFWSRCAEFGIQGLPFATEYGGSGQDAMTTVMAMEALGAGCKDGGLVFGLNAQMWSVQMPIAQHGTEDQKCRYLPRLASGEIIGAHGMSEPDSGSDAFGLRTTADLVGDVYVLNGTKTFVSNATVADVFVVFATVDRSLGARGVTGFLIDRHTPGFSVGKKIGKMGLTTSPMAELVLDGCVVPVANRLGREGRGATIFNDSMEWERACIMAPCVGAMERQLAACVTYARTRKQFGQPISDFQSVSNRLSAMKLRLETSRLILYRAAWSKQTKLPSASVDASMAKLYLGDAWIQSCLDAVQVHGGYGYMTEYEVERDLRDALGGTLYSGTSDIQKAIIARGIGL